MKPLTRAEVETRVARGISLARTHLAGLDLRGANLRGADLTGANLRGANLTGANLACADLRGADLTDADLCGAILTYANTEGTVGLNRANDEVYELLAALCTGTGLDPDEIRETTTGFSGDRVKGIVAVRHLMFEQLVARGHTPETIEQLTGFDRRTVRQALRPNILARDRETLTRLGGVPPPPTGTGSTPAGPPSGQTGGQTGTPLWEPPAAIVSGVVRSDPTPLTVVRPSEEPDLRQVGAALDAAMLRMIKPRMASAMLAAIAELEKS